MGYFKGTEGSPNRTPGSRGSSLVSMPFVVRRIAYRLQPVCIITSYFTHEHSKESMTSAIEEHAHMVPSV